jgi:ParB-like chromosome segregation protein Spo0J
LREWNNLREKQVKEQLKFQIMDISELVEYKLNAKLHPPEQIKQIENSITRFGMNDPIGIDEKSKVIIEGHGRLIACRNLGISKVPVISLGHLDEKQQRAYRLAHNKINMNSGFDDSMLADEIILMDEIELFTDAGFSESEIGLVLSDYGKEDKKPDIDDAPPLPEIPQSKLGDLYLLGRHRLLCGDATKHEDINRLMGG